MSSLHGVFSRIAVIGLGAAALVMVAATPARADQNEPLLDGWAGEAEPLPEAARVDPDEEGGGWLDRWTPTMPRLEILSPRTIWTKMSNGTRTVWTKTRKVVAAPWQRMRADQDRDQPRRSGWDFGLFSWRRQEEKRQQSESLTDWLSQPRPGS